MPINFKVSSSFRRYPTSIDLRKEMKKSAEIVAQEIRGAVKRGEDPTNKRSLPLNKASYSRIKLKKLGHSKPLIAKHKELTNPANYIIKIEGNKAIIKLSDKQHKESKATVAQIGAWNAQGTNRITARPFFGISEIARKRVRAMILDRIKDVLGTRRKLR